MPFLELVKSRFGRAAKTYDAAATHHQKIANNLLYILSDSIKNLKITTPKSILEIGSGTGLFSEQLSKIFPETDITLNDISEEMLATAKLKLESQLEAKRIGTQTINRFHYMNSAAETIDISVYDMIAANMSMQWLTDIYCFLLKTRRYRKNIAFSVPILGTLDSWYEILSMRGFDFNRIKYKSKDDMMNLCESAGYKYKITDEKEYIMRFDRVGDCARYLKSIGANIASKACDTSLLKEIIKMDEPLTTSYKVFFAVLGN